MSEVRGDDPLGGVPHHVSNPAFAPGAGSTRAVIPEVDVTDDGLDEVAQMEADELAGEAEAAAAAAAEAEALAAAQAAEEAAAAAAEAEAAAQAAAEAEAAAAAASPEVVEGDAGDETSDGSGGEA